MTGMYKQADIKYSNILAYQALRASLQAINVSDFHIIITLLSAKQVYNDRVTLFNVIEPVHSWACFPVFSGF